MSNPFSTMSNVASSLLDSYKSHRLGLSDVSIEKDLLFHLFEVFPQANPKELQDLIFQVKGYPWMTSHKSRCRVMLCVGQCTFVKPSSVKINVTSFVMTILKLTSWHLLNVNLSTCIVFNVQILCCCYVDDDIICN